jgi:hypothetical protein
MIVNNQFQPSLLPSKGMKKLVYLAGPHPAVDSQLR